MNPASLSSSSTMRNLGWRYPALYSATLNRPPAYKRGGEAGSRTHTRLPATFPTSNGGAKLAEDSIQNHPDLLGLPAIAVRAREHENLSCLKVSDHVEEHDRGVLPCVTNQVLGASK